MRIENVLIQLVRKYTPMSDTDKMELESDLYKHLKDPKIQENGLYKKFVTPYNDNPFVRVGLAFLFMFLCNRIEHWMNPNRQTDGYDSDIEI